jgi:aminoglycoside phosphotransferase (APT) family kinase protein
MPPVVVPVAERHRFDIPRLDAYLQREIEDFGNALVVRQFQGGASNPTFLLTTQRGGVETNYVLRKKPPGQLLASAHQVDREYRVMKALAQTDVPVPVMRHLCNDDTIIGTAFYVMDYLEGRIFRDATLPGISPADRREIYDQLNLTLTKLHKVNYEAVGLGDFGKPGNYFERQMARWVKQYRGAETERITEMEELMEELARHLPKDESTGITHGDYRPENTMFHPTEPKLIAVLDWELCTIGNPIADIAYNAYLWHSKGTGWGSLEGVDFNTSGIPTEEEYVDKYCERMGIPRIANLNWYMAFSVFRLASIGQGVYKRVISGQASMDRPAVNGTAEIARTALQILHR